MFGEIILVGGISLASGLISKGLEDIGKEKEAKYLTIAFHGGMAIYAFRLLNRMFKEVGEFL